MDVNGKDWLYCTPESSTCPDTAGSRTFSWSDIRDSANYAYASRPSNGWTRLKLIEETVDSLIDSEAAASFMEKEGVFVIAFRGTDGGGDWWNTNTDVSSTKIEDADGNTVAVHSGFFEYTEVLAPQVEEYRNWLESECGIAIDFITGHSLGGAAATLYADVYGEPLGIDGNKKFGVVTFGAPATHHLERRRRLEDYDVDHQDCEDDWEYYDYKWSDDAKDCIACIKDELRAIQVKGMRFYNEDDAIPNLLEQSVGYEHVVSHEESSYCTADETDCSNPLNCHYLTPGYDWVHKQRFKLPARPSKDPTPRPTPRPTSRPAPRPAPRPTQRPVSFPGGAACQTLVELCMDAETQSECDRSYKFDDGDYRTCYWNGNRCKFSDGNAEVCVGGGPRPAPRPTQRPTPRPTQRPSRNPTPDPTRTLTPHPTRTLTSRPTSQPPLLPTDKEESESKSSGKKLSAVMTYVIGALAVVALLLCAFAAGLYCKKGKKEKPIKKPMPIASAVPEFKETKSPQEPKRDREPSIPPEATMTSAV